LTIKRGDIKMKIEMRQRSRRTELGKMLLDISKYLSTVGIIGGVIIGGLSLKIGVALFVVAASVAIVGFYTIPEDNKKEN
jgi:hypothetical protein